MRHRYSRGGGEATPWRHAALAPAGCAAKASCMTEVQKILLLAGSFEARRVAEALTAGGVPYDAWLSEAPRGAAPMPQIPLLRRFECQAQMQEAIAQGGYTAVLDASHVFDRTVTQVGYAAARALGLPYLRLERPAWETTDYPRWRSAASPADANAMIPDGAQVFCATGWDSLPDFADFRGARLLLRQTRRHARPAPYPHVELVFGDPPFSVAQEKALFARLGVDLLICRNIGGAASRPKLDAARALDLDVILIGRPPTPEGLAQVAEIDAAIAWVTAQ
jgi:precorrin-6A/cobalt-precorrin-6A reductase